MPSETFKDCICNGGTPVADCEWCGRTYFAGGDAYYDPGEYELLKFKSQEMPEKYIEVGDMDGISFGVFAGRQFVWHCDCTHLDRYEKFIVENRHLIVDFLQRRSEAIQKMAGAESDLVNRLERIR